MVIVTGQERPPIEILTKIWKNSNCEFQTPNFSKPEIEEIALLNGLNSSKENSNWIRTIHIATHGGHPQLVHAMCRNLSTKQWPLNKLLDFQDSEDVIRVKDDARKKLISEFPSKKTRILAYRLSIVSGQILRETVMAIASVAPKIRLPGESFDQLLGPWIEREGDNQFRISPLLQGAAEENIDESEIKSVHSAIATNIVSRKNINHQEAGSALFHAIKAQNKNVLFTIAQTIVNTSCTEISRIYDTFSWFSFVFLGKGEQILKEGSEIEVILRLAQYKLISNSIENVNVEVIIDRVEESLINIESYEGKMFSEKIAYTIILNSINVYISPVRTIKMLSRLIDIDKAGIKLKKHNSTKLKEGLKLINLEGNKIIQDLFLFQGTRIRGLDDFSELMDLIDKLELPKKKLFLNILETDENLASHIVDMACLNEIKKQNFDFEKAIHVFKVAEIKSKEWKVNKLRKACLLTISVIEDEYAHRLDLSLKVIKQAEKYFPNDAKVLYQKAKIYFHMDNVSEALMFTHKAIKHPNLKDIDFVFCCQIAGISVAKQEDWIQAEYFFKLGSDKALESSFQYNMGIGLLADLAFCLWKQGKFKKSLILYADILDELIDISCKENLRVKHLHATVRHCITWIHYEKSGYIPDDLKEPVPGLCSNQNPHEGFNDLEIVGLETVWRLLEITELMFNKDFGIKERASEYAFEDRVLLIESYYRSCVLDLAYKHQKFEDLILILINSFEMINYDMKDFDKRTLGRIPPLPIDFWKVKKNKDSIHFYLLKACLFCIACNIDLGQLTTKWKKDVDNIVINSDDINEFINVINGEEPNKTLSHQAALSLYKINLGVLNPKELWNLSFKLLNYFMYERASIEKVLEGVIVTRWLYAINNQLICFSDPKIVFSKAEICCLNQSLSGLSKIAQILEITAPFLGFRLDKNAIKMLRDLK